MAHGFMKNLIFNVKRNLKRPPKIYVLSSDKKITYGSFSAADTDEFDGWNLLSPVQLIELKQYMHNMRAISRHFDNKGLNEQADFRLRLPSSFIQCINEINALAAKSDIELDIFEPIITSLIQQLKITTTKLSNNDKKLALASLDRLGLAEYKKIDYSTQIQNIFSELLTIHNKSEKLESLANSYFNKSKMISPKSIDDIAHGRLSTSKWLVSCAIQILLDERPVALKGTFSDDDLFMLWAKPLLDHGLEKKMLLSHALSMNLNKLIERIEDYSQHTIDRKDKEV